MCFVSPGNECLKTGPGLYFMSSPSCCVCTAVRGWHVVAYEKEDYHFPFFLPSEASIRIYETCEKNRHNETRKLGLEALVGAHLELVAF